MRDTIHEVAGKLQMRNRSSKLEPQDGVVLVHERCDLYARTGTEWVFYSRFRATTLLQEKKDGWKNYPPAFLLSGYQNRDRSKCGHRQNCRRKPGTSRCH